MFSVRKTVWKYQVKQSAWYFVSFTEQEVLEGLNIEKKPRGWGQIPVQVTIGDTVWNTSLFRSKQRGYDLPIKAVVRKNEHIDEGDTTQVGIEPAS